jgi:hypothetical protein
LPDASEVEHLILHHFHSAGDTENRGRNQPRRAATARQRQQQEREGTEGGDMGDSVCDRASVPMRPEQRKVNQASEEENRCSTQDHFL